MNEIIFRLAGYDKQDLQKQLNRKTNFETSFSKPEDKFIQQIHYLDKLFDTFTKDEAMEKILRKWPFLIPLTNTK